MRVTREKEATEKRRRERENMKDKEKQHRQMLEAQQREAQNQQAAESIKGRLLFFLRTARDNKTPREYSMAGLELVPKEINSKDEKQT